jgi:hypothetical protein
MPDASPPPVDPDSAAINSAAKEVARAAVDDRIGDLIGLSPIRSAIRNFHSMRSAPPPLPPTPWHAAAFVSPPGPPDYRQRS